MRVSVIVTTYNNPLFLKKVLAGFLLQRREPDELLIADDGSGHDTADVVKEFASVAVFPVYHVWQEDRGFRAGTIRNLAIARSSGDYIILLDGDCVINRDFIFDHVSLAEKDCFLQGKRLLVSKEKSETFSTAQANSSPRLFRMALEGSIRNVHHLLAIPCYPAIRNRKLKGIKSCNMSFFRDDILAVNGFNEDFVGWGNEDSELAYRFFTYGLKKKVHPFKAICFHLWHATSKIVPLANVKLLAGTMASSEFYCKNGLVKER